MKNFLLSLFFLLLFLGFFSSFTTMGVVFDIRMPIVLLSIALTVIFAILFYRNRKKITAFYFFLSVILLLLSVWENFFRYSEEEINFTSDGKNLYGTLYSPLNQSSSCLIIFIHGSGKASRLETAFHARRLARRGISAFAYDKRGSGKSEGDVYEVGYSGYAQDAIQAIKKIGNTHSYEKVGLFGISEGEWVSLIIAAQLNIDFIVLISASGTSPYEQTLRETTYRLEKKDFNEIDIKEAENLYSKILRFDNSDMSRKRIEKEISQAVNKNWFHEGEEFEEELYYFPWWEEVMDFSPQDFLKESDTPILVLTGKNNSTYPYFETKQNYKQFSQVTVKVFESGDHAMLDWPLGKNIPPPFFSEGYLNYYTQWIKSYCIEDKKD